MITNFNTNFLLGWIFRVNCGQSGHGASQEASITTKGGHNRRQAPVIY